MNHFYILHQKKLCTNCNQQFCPTKDCCLPSRTAVPMKNRLRLNTAVLCSVYKCPFICINYCMKGYFHHRMLLNTVHQLRCGGNDIHYSLGKNMNE